MKILVTGAAGFIGSFTATYLLKAGHEVFGLDNLNDYYDVQLKKDRLQNLETHPSFKFEKANIADQERMRSLFQQEKFDRVVHLAAQAGVRHSLKDPFTYVDSNIMGFLNILEGCRQTKVEHLVYASTSSAYGLNSNLPFKISEPADHPASFYAATKKANEMMAHSYSHMYDLPTTGLRFFTVYGPWDRPDMALFSFTKNILAGKPIDVFNDGKHARDFTYVDDIVEGVCRVALGEPSQPDPKWDSANPNPATSSAPYRLFNIGNNRSVKLMHYIEVLENCLGKKAEKRFLPLQNGDVPETHADVTELIEAYDYQPRTTVETGIANFVAWYRDYYK